MPHIVVLYNEPTLPADHPDADSEYDILYTADHIAKILQHAGLSVERLGITDDPALLISALKAAKPDAVFNLYEGLAGWGNTEAYVSGILELLRIPFTGSPTQPLLLCRSKPLTKQLLAGAGIPTAPFFVVEHGTVPICPLPWPVIVKPGREDASVGIDQLSVCTNQQELEARVDTIRRAYGPSVLIEAFIRGREFNVALVEQDGVPTPLPFSEILFVPPPHAPHLWPIVSFDAKWRPDTLDFTATPAKNPADVTPELQAEVSLLARKAYELVGCRDYARVDFRVDEIGNVFVLEVNPNPCISPLAGLAAGLETAKVPYGAFIVNLAKAALRRGADPESTDTIEYRDEATPPAVRAVTEATPKQRHRVRETRRADVEALSALLQSNEVVGGFPAPEFKLHLGRLMQRKDRRGRRLLTALRRKTIVGCIVLSPAENGQGIGIVEAIWVHPDSRKAGVGRLLLEAGESLFASVGLRLIAVHLSSGPGDATARQFLQECRYRPAGEWSDYDRDGYARLTFTKPLPPSVPPASVSVPIVQAVV